MELLCWLVVICHNFLEPPSAALPGTRCVVAIQT